MPVALVREVPDSFVRAIVGTRGRAPDVALAKEQHRHYVKRLTGAGYSIERLAADEACPDCVFVEDTAVILGEVAVVTRPGAESRRSEVAAVAGFLEKRFEMAQIEEPGTVDGGDVMIVDGKVYVGESARTNRDGIAQLASITAEQGLELIPVRVVGMLHLKSAVVPVGDQTVVVTPGAVDEVVLDGLRIVHEADRERGWFSALPLIDGNVLVSASAPDTSREVASLGYAVIPVEISEILAANGGLTCMSIIYGE